MDLKSDPQAFYKAIQTTLRELTGKALPPLLKRWRNTRSLDSAVTALSPDKLRFLARLGMLDSGTEPDDLSKTYAALTERISRSSGDAPGIVDGWLDLFASGEYGVLEHAVCAPEPRCNICPLGASCRYLASGGSDARAFGAQLGQELRNDPAGLRAADMLAFALSGERAGAADIARAEAALKAFRGLRGLFLAPASELRAAGFDPQSIARLQSIAELCRNWAEERTERGKAFRQGRDFYDYFHLRLRDLKKEVFMVVMVDQKNFLIGEEIVSEGSLTETLVHPREVFVRAVRERAAAVAVVHNHPSGDPAPSSQDRAITRRLKSAAELIGIRLLDHVIVGDGRYFSFVEEDAME
jgi:DNA repair protein RadC